MPRSVQIRRTLVVHWRLRWVRSCRAIALPELRGTAELENFRKVVWLKSLFFIEKQRKINKIRSNSHPDAYLTTSRRIRRHFGDIFTDSDAYLTTFWRIRRHFGDILTHSDAYLTTFWRIRRIFDDILMYPMPIWRHFDVSDAYSKTCCRIRHRFDDILTYPMPTSRNISKIYLKLILNLSKIYVPSI